MNTLKNRIPKLRKHKSSGRAVVTLDGRDHYLGRHGTKTSRNEYNRLVAEWLARERHLPTTDGATVAEVCAAFLRHATGYYRKNGKPTSELWLIKRAIRILRPLYGKTAAEAFGPLALKAVRQTLIDRKDSRTYINATITRIVRTFRWGAEHELVSGNIYKSLSSVPTLRKGRSPAPEKEPVKPVAGEYVDATLPHVSREVAAMIQLQRLTGMRPGEVVIMRTCDVDVSGKSWTYRPESHKCEHHGIAREIELGPKAQRLLRQWFRPNVTEYVFRPDEAEGKRKAELRRRRKSKVQPSQQSRRKKSPKCKPTDRYSTDSYRRAISRACEKYDISQWFPNQLRHLFATEVRRRFGIEMARACLGHRSVLVTQVYAEVNRQAASEVVAKIG